MARAETPKLSTAQIGRCGELLVQYRLLLLGVESAAMTTDSGIDLVAYSPKSARPKTIQVKTNLRAKPGGGKGKPALDWWLHKSNRAQLIALVDLKGDRVWLLEREEMETLAQQNTLDKLHFYMYTDAGYVPKKYMSHVADFEHLRLECRVPALFGHE